MEGGGRKRKTDKGKREEGSILKRSKKSEGNEFKLIFCIDVPQRCLKKHAKAKCNCDMTTL